MPRRVPCRSGDMRRAALSSVRMAPVLIPPTCVGLLNRDTDANASPRSLFTATCLVRIDVHGSKDRVKDASAGASDDLSCVLRVHVLRAHARRVPLLGTLRTSAVTGAASPAGGSPQVTTDRPRSSFRQHPAKEAAFRKTRMPSTVTTREGDMRGGIAPSGLRAGSPAHAAHTISPAGESALKGIARSQCGHPRIRDLESTSAFTTR